MAIFVKDDIEAADWVSHLKIVEVNPFNAGSPVINPDFMIDGTDKTFGEMYTNAKAQAHAITAQKFYNTYRFIVLGERDINPEDMISIDVEDEALFLKIAREMSTALWVKSETNSKKKVESKKDMEKRTGQASPNINDSVIMCYMPDVGLSSMIFAPSRFRSM